MKKNNTPPAEIKEVASHGRVVLLSERPVAEMLGVSVATLRRWRLRGQGPRFMKIGALCRYDLDGVIEWLDTCPAGGGR